MEFDAPIAAFTPGHNRIPSKHRVHPNQSDDEFPAFPRRPKPYAWRHLAQAGRSA